MAKRAGMTAVVSHRSGETEDATIADILLQQTQDKSKLDQLQELIEWLNITNY